MRSFRKLPRGWRIALVVFVSVLGLVCVACLVMAVAGLRDDVAASDVAIVLGSKVELDGKPSARLEARLGKALELYRRGLFANIIVSGGIGQEGYDEARVMRDWLVANGVPAGSVIEDNRGATTWDTAMNSARIMKERGWQSALVVSQYFHVPRCRLACRKVGIAEVHGAHADYYAVRDFYSLPREVGAYLKYWVRRSR